MDKHIHDKDSIYTSTRAKLDSPTYTFLPTGVTVKNIPTRENIPPVCFRVRSYAKLYPPDGRLVCGNVTFDSV